MASRCDLGLHKWEGGCQCALCGAKRDEHHAWNGCRCEICGQERDEEHDWDGCVCRKCGYVLGESNDCHDWNGCTCRKCGTVRGEGHDLDDGCVCRICGKELHNWRWEIEEIADTETFEEMGGGLENMWMMHQQGDTIWTCMRCGKVERRRSDIPF